MIIELGDFFSSQKSSFPLDLCFSPEDGADATGMIPADLKIKENGIVLKGEIRSVGDYLSLVSAVTVKYGALCDRCLEPFDAEMTFEFDRQIVAFRGDRARGADRSSLPRGLSGTLPDVWKKAGRSDLQMLRKKRNRSEIRDFEKIT